LICIVVFYNVFQNKAVTGNYGTGQESFKQLYGERKIWENPM